MQQDPYIAILHNLTENYEPQAPIIRRKNWDQDSGFAVVKQGLNPKDKLMYQRFHQFMEWIESLDRSSKIFGLVHADLHHGNFFVSGGEIEAFDFDDAVYHWHAYDIAVSLINLANMCDEGFFDKPFSDLYSQIINGYLSQRPMCAVWLNRIDLFMKFRMCTVYHWLRVGINDGIFNKAQLEWSHKMMSWAKKQLIYEVKFL